MSRISIVTTTYNRSYLLSRTIENVLSQSFDDFEYIIINNGSTDDTHLIISKYAESDSRIRVITRKQNDTSFNSFYKFVEELFSTPEAPYCMWIDDDDFMDLNTVETLYKLITEYDADIATVGSVFVYPDGTRKNKFVFDGVYVYSRIEAMKEMLKREKFNSAAGGKIYKKKVFENLDLPCVSSLRDIYREYRVISNITRMVVTGEPMFNFYRHDKNLSGLDNMAQITPERMLQHLEGNELRTEWLAKKMPEISDFALYCELSFMISLYERIHRLEVFSCYDIADDMKKKLESASDFLYTCEFCTEREKAILETIYHI